MAVSVEGEDIDRVSELQSAIKTVADAATEFSGSYLYVRYWGRFLLRRKERPLFWTRDQTLAQLVDE